MFFTCYLGAFERFTGGAELFLSRVYREQVSDYPIDTTKKIEKRILSGENRKMKKKKRKKNKKEEKTKKEEAILRNRGIKGRTQSKIRWNLSFIYGKK